MKAAIIDVQTMLATCRSGFTTVAGSLSPRQCKISDMLCSGTTDLRQARKIGAALVPVRLEDKNIFFSCVEFLPRNLAVVWR